MSHLLRVQLDCGHPALLSELLHGLLSLLGLYFREFVTGRHLIKLLRLTVLATIFHISCPILITIRTNSRLTSGIGLQIVVLWAHEVLVSQVLSVWILQVVISKLDLLLDGVDGVCSLSWESIVISTSNSTERLRQRISLDNRWTGDKSPEACLCAASNDVLWIVSSIQVKARLAIIKGCCSTKWNFCDLIKSIPSGCISPQYWLCCR